MPVPRHSGYPSIIAYWEKFVPDILLLLLSVFCTSYLMDWQLKHPGLSCFILMALNIIAVSIGCFSFFSGYADMKKLLAYSASLHPFEKACLGLSVFVSSIAFCWWLVPFAALPAMGVQESGFLWGALVYFICFLTVVAGSITSTKALQIQQQVFIKAAGSLSSGLFFFFSYSFLLLTMQHWQPGFMGARYAAMLCLTVFYLPLRFFLLLRPPFHPLEYPLFIISYGFLLFKLFVNL